MNKSTINEMELLTVIVGDQPFGINIDKIQSIQQYNQELITSLPEKQPGIAGMFLYRNKTIPLLDLSLILGIDKLQEVDNEIIIVTEFNKKVNSLKVQGVKRIYRMSWEQFIPLDQFFGDNSFFTGSVNVDDMQVMILDLEHILAKIFPDVLIEELSADILEQKEDFHREHLEIIFAEDSPTMKKAAIKQLQKAGYTNVSDFNNGEKAFDYIKNKFKDNPENDISQAVLISDIDMPVLDGLTLCKQIKTDPELKNIYIVMYSCLINKQMICKCNAAEADTCINKPEINGLIKILDKRCKK